MKRLFIILSAVAILAACKNETTKQLCMDLSHIQAFVPADDVDYYADSINGYATFSAENNIMIIPEEITKEQYEDLLRDKCVFRSNEIESGTALYAELDKKAGKNVAKQKTTAFDCDPTYLQQRGQWQGSCSWKTP